MVNTIRLNHHSVAILTLCLMLTGTTLALATDTSTAQPLTVSDGRTQVLTPQGTWIVPPPGAPLAIIAEPEEVAVISNGTPWGLADFTPEATPTTGVAAMSTSSCTGYRAGWYATDQGYLWGGHAGIRPQNLPIDTSKYCPGTGMGYTDGVTFGMMSWIQAGVVIFPGETSAKWMCQANDDGTLTTKYGPANAYGNGATVYTWFARDSAGVWRTYRYDTGPYSVELGCTIVRGHTNGDPLQVFGEIQGAMSTSAPMGVWSMFDLRYLGTDNVWRVPTNLQAHYKSGTPCPPYGAGSVLAGVINAGSGTACATGTSAYPN